MVEDMRRARVRSRLRGRQPAVAPRVMRAAGDQEFHAMLGALGTPKRLRKGPSAKGLTLQQPQGIMRSPRETWRSIHVRAVAF